MGFLALGTAACNALGAIIIAEVVAAAGGPMALSRWRTLIATVLLAALALATRGFATITLAQTFAIAGSGICSVVIADPALNAGFARIGARRTALLYSLNAPIAALLAWLFLDETLTPRIFAALLLIFGGITLAVMYGYAPMAPAGRSRRPPAGVHGEAAVTLAGLGFGLTAALGQAAGTVLIRPVMESGASPFAVMAWRAAIGAVALWGFFLVRPGPRPGPSLPDWRTFAWIALGTAISFVLGMSLLMAALSSTRAGIAATLSSTTPVVILPMLWLRTGRPASWRAWIGALLAVAGAAVLFA